MYYFVQSHIVFILFSSIFLPFGQEVSLAQRDIAKAVNIKESSIYYHFKNKQDILDSLVEKFESHMKELTDMLQASMSDSHNVNAFSWDWLREFYFEQYLFDTFCNQMMRFMMIEQFHNENMRMLYERYLFELPHKIQTQSFMMLSKLGILSEQQAIKVSNDFFASITMLTFKYLLKGKLTKTKKEAFSEETFTYINRMFQED